MKRIFTLLVILGFGVSLLGQTPTVVKDINPDGDAIGYYFEESITEFDGGLFFTANDGTFGYELWRTDGTEAGTVLVKDINEGIEGSGCRKLYPAGDLLFFLATDEEHGEELWCTDGTEAETYLVKDILPGPQSGIYADAGLSNDHYVWNDILYFGADDGTHGYELWRSDGTEAGTFMVKDVAEGSTHSYPRYFVEHGGKLFFSAGGALWSTDGTEAGTLEVSDKIYPQHTVSANDYLLCIGSDGFSNYELWRSDGTDAGTVVVKEINSDGSSYGCTFPSEEELVKVGDVIYFSANDGTGKELWRSDGTEAGTYMVRDASIDEYVGCAKAFTILDDVLYYSFNDGTNGHELWRSDGTEAGTYMVKDMIPGSSSSFSSVSSKRIAAIGNRLYFGAGNNAPNDLELWQSDGTEEGTALVAELYPGITGSGPQSFYRLGNDLLFVAESFGIGYELWTMPLPTSVQEPSFSEVDLKLVPSLTDGIFTVVISEKADAVNPFNVTLISTTGTPLKMWSDVVSGQELDIYDIPAGMYFVQISDEKGGVGVRALVVGF